MTIKEQFREFYEALKTSSTENDIDHILNKYWFSWCCPKKEISIRSKRMANHLLWLVKSPLINKEWRFELNNTMDSFDKYFDEIRIVNAQGENIFILSYSFNYEENQKIDLWELENDYEMPVASQNIKNIQRYLKISL